MRSMSISKGENHTASPKKAADITTPVSAIAFINSPSISSEKLSRPSHLKSTPDSTQSTKKVSSRRATTTTLEIKTSSLDSDAEPSDISSVSSCSSFSVTARDKISSEMQTSVTSEYRVSSTSTESPPTAVKGDSTPTNDVKSGGVIEEGEGENILESKQPIDPMDSKSAATTEDTGTNLIVNYLPQNMTQEDIKSLFASIGEVESCKLIRDKTTCQNLGYGFVNYVNTKDAERAINTLNGLCLQNKTIKVSLARPSSESIKGANLYISGLPKSYTQQEMDKLFASCGKIITSRILYDNNTGLSRGVGFIRFDRRSEAEYAIRHLNGAVPSGFTESITVKLANSPSGSSVNAVSSVGGLINPAVHQRQHQQRHQELLLATAAAAAVAAESAELKASLLPPPLSSTHPLSMAFMHQMASLPSTFALAAHPIMPVAGQAQLHLTSFHDVPELTSSRQLLTGMTTIHVPGANEEILTAAPLIGLTLASSPPPSLVISQGLHHLPPTTAVSVAAAAANATRIFDPLNTMYPLSVPTIGQDNSTVFSPLTSMSPNAQPAPLIAPVSPLTSPPPVPPSTFIRPRGSSAGGDHWCLFVYNLAPETEEATLWRLFGPFGAVRSISVAKDYGPGSKCLGFGFVNMTNYKDALHAIQKLNGHVLGNRILQVTFKTLNFNPRAPLSAPNLRKQTKI